MKKLIVLLTILLLNTVAFSQVDNFRSRSVIEDQSYLLNLKTIENSGILYYFKANGMLYVLAYRVNDESNWDRNTIDVNNLRTKRDLILYRLEAGKWIASSTVVQTDYSLLGVEQDYGTHKTYCDVEYSKLRKSGGQVRALTNGSIIFLLNNQYINPEDKDAVYKYNAIAILVPNGDATYVATRFEPKNKKLLDLAATDTLEIFESGNNIKLNFWNRYTCNANENPDGFAFYDSDTNGKKVKIYYKKKFGATLNFKINGTSVDYVSPYSLIKIK